MTKIPFMNYYIIDQQEQELFMKLMEQKVESAVRGAMRNLGGLLQIAGRETAAEVAPAKKKGRRKRWRGKGKGKVVANGV